MTVERALRAEIAELHEAQAALGESEGRFRAVFDHALDAMILADDGARCADANPMACELLGRSRSALVGAGLDDLLGPGVDFPVLWRALRDAGSQHEVRVPHGRIGFRDVELVATADVLPGTHLFILRDVTPTKRIESLQRVEAAIARIFTDCDSIQAALEQALPTIAEALACASARLWAHSDPAVAQSAVVRRAFETGESGLDGGTALVAVKAAGRTVAVLELLSPASWFAADDVAEIAERLADAYRRRAAEEALAESEAILAEAERTARMGAWWYDPATHEYHWSDEHYRIFGFAPRSVRPSRELWRERVHAEDREHVEAVVSQGMRARRAFAVEYRVVLPDGAVRMIVSQAAPRATGPDSRISGTSQDVTELRALEDRIRQGQKLEAIGRLAGGVAHDFNNLLTAIIANTDMAIANAGSVSAQDLQEIKDAATRAAALTGQLLAFSRRQVLTPRVLDPNALVTSLQRMLVRLIPEDIDLLTELDPGARRVRADPVQLEQVVLNLVVNARDAIAGRGRIVVGTKQVDLAAPLLMEHGSVPPGSYLALSVTDNGCGMDDATRAHLFEPFFTTKSADRGTGLGLATVYGVVHQSGGHIQVVSERGSGTTMTIYLQSVDEPADPLRRPSVIPRTLRGTESVLLVEDDAAVRRAVTRMLKLQGYKIVSAGSPREALDMARGFEFDLLISDVVMPVMTGPELLEALRAAGCSRLKTLFMSGHSHEALDGRGVPEGAAFIQKPFTAREIAEAIRSLLDR